MDITNMFNLNNHVVIELLITNNVIINIKALFD
jgi:hypothetical protein